MFPLLDSWSFGIRGFVTGVVKGGNNKAVKNPNESSHLGKVDFEHNAQSIFE